MRPWLAPLAALVGLAHAQSAGAEERRVEGEVVSAEARFAADGRTIVTDSVVRDPDGRLARLRQLGGSVDGIGMVVSHGPPLLRPGDRVVARAHDRGAGVPMSLRAIEELAPAALEGVLPFVRTRTRSGAPLHWQSRCVFVSYDADGVSHVAGDGELDVLDASFATWERDSGSCSYLSFVLDGVEEREVGFDRTNLVKFREASWCRPASGNQPAECYDPAAAGITTIFFVDDPASKRDGEIVDADIELNAVHFSISVGGQSLGPQNRCQADLANTMTHEVGHLLGLDHTCWDGTGTRPEDHLGQPIPSCIPEAQLPPDVTEATMYNFQDCGETKKANLTADDVDAVCAAYAIEDDPRQCSRVVQRAGCCNAGGGPGGSSAALALLCALLAARPWRRRRPSSTR